MAETEKQHAAQVHICGMEHTVKGDAPAEYIQRLAQTIDARITSIQHKNPNLTGQRAAILVALNLADELEKLQAEYQDILKLMEESQ